jgi:hypothetical protein
MSLIKRLVKGTPLTFAEGDANLEFLENLANTTGSFATTGSNQFIGAQTIYGNLTVFGTSSISYITSSQLNISTNLITVNTSTPSVRFGGLAVYDSGSTGLTGSMLWDSQTNHWIYTNPSGSSYSGGMLISGPRNTGSMGDEQGTILNALMKGQGGDHITSSALFEDGSTFTSKVNTVITGSLTVTGIINGSLTGSIESASFASTASQAANAISASYASIASQAANATSASYALVSSQAANATSASYAMMVDASHTSSYSIYAISASYASTASQAANATSASYAMMSDTASYAMMVDEMHTSSYSIYAETSSYAVMSTTASYAMMSDTASYAMMVDEMHTSSYSIYAETSSRSFNSISSSYALSASSADLLDGYHKSILATTSSNVFSGSQVINGDISITGTGSLSIQGLPIGTGANKISSNVAIGVNTLFNNVSASNIRNIAIGDFSYFSLTSGSNNVGIGLNTGFSLLAGTNNSSYGSRSGTDLISGSNNTFIGTFAGSNLTTGSNNTFIGAVILPQTSSINNTIIIADGLNNQRLTITNSGLAIFSNSLYVSGSTTTSGSLTVQRSTAILSQVSQSFNFTNDAEASGSGIPLGGLYHTSGTIKIRLV